MSDSYSLREVAEILGVTPRALQRRIDEGGFPGRFNASGRNGLETRIPSVEVERELEVRRRRGLSVWRRADEPSLTPPLASPREVESLVPYAQPELVDSHAVSSSGTSALTQSDLESMRDAMLAIVREDREMFLGVVREALVARDREIGSLRNDLASMQRSVDGVRTGLESIERRLKERRSAESAEDPQVWADILATDGTHSTLDVDALLREISDLERLLAR